MIRLDRKTYMARYRDSDGIIREVSTGCTTKAAAYAKLLVSVKESERIAAGVVTKEETELADWKFSPVLDAVAEYFQYVEKRSTVKRKKGLLRK